MLLHDAAFQRLEATWRGVRWLLANTGEIDEGDSGIFLHLTREELRVKRAVGESPSSAASKPVRPTKLHGRWSSATSPSGRQTGEWKH